MSISCNQMPVLRQDVLGDVAEVLDLGLNAPVPIVLLEKLVLVEETVDISTDSAMQKDFGHTQSRICTCGDNSPYHRT
jgi:hypothetical protein